MMMQYCCNNKTVINKFDNLSAMPLRKLAIVSTLPIQYYAPVFRALFDVGNHFCLIGGDSLPMHFALGSGTRCVTLFTCTSPWEIYDYGIQTKIVSPLLKEFFYKRGYDERATTAITVDEVFNAVMTQLEATVPAATHATIQ